MISYAGLFAVDGTLTASVLSVSDGVTLASPGADPTYTIRDSAGSTLTSGTGTATSVVANELYRINHSLASGDGYTAGSTYTCDVRYTTGGTNRAQLILFQVV